MTKLTVLRLTLGLFMVAVAASACKEEVTSPPTTPPPPAATPSSVSVTSAPAALASVGETVELTAEAKDASGNTLTGIDFTWSTSADNIATVQANSPTATVTAVANGTATITATTTTGDVSGTTDVMVQVVPAKLAFIVQPADQAFGAAIVPAIEVELRDARDNKVVAATNSVTLSIKAQGSDPGGGTFLPAMVSAVAGVASFNNVSVDEPGLGYTIEATSGTLTAATSSAFTVLGPFIKVAVGSSHTCALTTLFKAYCWGDNSSGQLGNAGAPTDQSTPVAVSGTGGFGHISAGGFHTCGRRPGGANTVLCWGENAAGQLGDDNAPTDSPIPVTVNASFVDVWTGENHTCARAATTLVANCWGINAQGQLGDNTTTQRDAPTAVNGNPAFEFMRTTGNTTCAINSTGNMRCWGLNTAGETGNGNTTSPVTTPATVNSDNLDFIALGTGHGHTCGITGIGDPDNDAQCWGQNDQGQLGRGNTTTNETAPALITGFKFDSIAGGTDFTCGLTTADDAYCWGTNTNGQLGTGDMSDHRSPFKVDTNLKFDSIDADFSHACAVAQHRVILCWGFNDQGQLGDGSMTTRRSPVVVSMAGVTP